MLAPSQRLLALGGVQRILAVTGVDRDIDHRGMSFLHGGSKLLEILRVGGRKDRAPGLDLVNVELVDDVRRKVLEFDLLCERNLAGRVSVPPFPSDDEVAKGIGRDSNPVPRCGRELNGGPRTSCCSRKGRKKPGGRGRGGTLPKKLSSIGGVHARQCTREGWPWYVAADRPKGSARRRVRESSRHSKYISALDA